MGFARAVRTCLVKFADFSGRAGIGEFWLFSLFQFLTMTLLIMVDFLRISGASDPAAFSANPMSFVALWGSLFFFLPIWAVLVRRLHDTDRSGFWVLINFIPLGCIVLLVFTVLPGTLTRNRFGPPPNAPRAASASRVPNVPRSAPEAMAQSAKPPATDIRALRLSRMQGTSAS